MHGTKYISYACDLLLEQAINKGNRTYDSLNEYNKCALVGCYLSNKYDVLKSLFINEKDKQSYQNKINAKLDDVFDSISCVDLDSFIKPFAKSLFELGADGMVHPNSAIEFTTAFCKEFIKHYPDQFEDAFERMISEHENPDNTDEREEFFFDVAERVRDMNESFKDQR